ncbi:hypothetical protein [Actinosynnema sp. NPDC020468]|uniref:hypothetical protein n=1 Tax=Actinosynnema sp. NPDC020468 TaxID=3154488 RepID=UPI0033F83AEF
MRLQVGSLTFAAVLAAAGCGVGKPDAPPVTVGSTAVSPKTSAVVELGEAFTADHSAASWHGKVTSAELDGKAVIIRTTFTKAEAVDAVPVCEAGRATAGRVGADFVSVTVRTADDASIAAWNKLRGDTACGRV